MADKVVTTQEQFEEIHRLLDGTRAKKIEIPRALLSGLLQDHSTMIGVLDNIITIRKEDENDNESKEA